MLIINAALKLGKLVPKTAFNLVIIILIALLSVFTPINAIFLLLGAMLIGIIAHLVTNKNDQPKGGKA